ncbi:MAG: hypothetical protein NC186_08495 [Prevotella sp.]|nr:hypothetical protein [Prevotella sp.]
MKESTINTNAATTAPASVPKVSYPPSLPISRKAYRRFIDRINEVYSAELPVARLMVSVLDVYLLGDRRLAGSMLEGSDHKHAFSFLCQDVDMAIERSRRARQQALARRLARQQAEAIVPAITPAITPTTPTASTSVISTIPSTSAPSVSSASSDNNDNIPEEPHSDLTKAESAILSGQEIGGHEVWSGRRVNDMSRIPMFSSLLNPVVNTIARTRAERRAQEQTLKRKLKSRNRPLT